MTADGSEHLQRSLTLRHVYALSTGAMFSSGLFLLPGLAAAKAGPAAILAYAIAGVLAVPAMLSVAELSTAMPRAGGAYFFVERALGPSAGTVAGIGTWLSLVLKDAFALVGMSAYLHLVFDIPNTLLAVVLIIGFIILNIAGARNSASLQLFLVAFVLLVLGWFFIAGLDDVATDRQNLSPFFEKGAGGVLAVVGLVFVSYGGLTKVASVAEEIEDPSRTIPLGMALSLLTATITYTLGALVAVAVINPLLLHEDLAPIHSAAEVVMPRVGEILIVFAALAAFASAVNAGIFAAARYPLAMSRDGLMPEVFGRLTRRRTPAISVAFTGLAMAIVVLLFDAEAIAKLASAFVLLTLGLVNLAVIVFRQSGITSYAPGFRAPFYPWLQIFGVLVTVVLTSQLGLLALLLLPLSIIIALGWYRFYGYPRTSRVGAVRHVFERWGRSADPALDRDISQAMQSHGLREADDYTGLIARAAVISIPDGVGIDEAAKRASKVLSIRLEMEADDVSDHFLDAGSLWIQPSDVHPTATPVAFFDDLERDELVIARATGGIRIPASWGGSGEQVNALFFVAGNAGRAGRALRLAGELAGHLHEDGAAAVGVADTEDEVKRALLSELSLVQYTLFPETEAAELIGCSIGSLTFRHDTVIASVTRVGKVMMLSETFLLEADDMITIVGPSDALPEIPDLVRHVRR